VSDPPKEDFSSVSEEERVESLARELADRLRNLSNRQELTDYAVSVLRESAEDAGQAEQARQSVDKAAKADAFNPIAFGIPLFIVGLVLCATGLLVGPGLGVIALALVMVLYGLIVAVFSSRKIDKPREP
jgi:Flp pilus assembly protein TadB